MSDHDHDHDRAIERAIEHLAASDPDRHLAIVGSEALERSYTDLLALLPFAEQPVVPEASIKATLLKTVTGQNDDRLADPVSAAPASLVPKRRTRPQQAWTLALAAMFGICLVGLAFLAGRVSEQREQIGALESLIEKAGAENAEQNAVLRAQFKHYARNLDMITTIAREAYPMHVKAEVMRATVGAGRKAPRGVVWVCGRHQRWYLNVQGLQPAPAGFAYTLWFVTEDGFVNGGVLDVSGNRPSELEAQFMPVGTNSFQVTLERGDPRGEPTGRPVLVADHAIAL